MAGRVTVDGGTARFVRPTGAVERVVVLDTVRGFALLGVMLVNMQTHLGEAAHLTDSVAAVVIGVLARGKFYPLFSMLFGVGLAIQFSRLEEGRVRVEGFVLRRLLGLYVIGTLFYILIDANPILLQYAVVGVPVVFMRHLSARWLWLVVTCALAFAIVQPGWNPGGARGVVPGTERILDGMRSRADWQAERRERAYGEWVTLRLSTYMQRWPGATAANTMHVFALVLVGFLVGNRRVVGANILDGASIGGVGPYCCCVGVVGAVATVVIGTEGWAGLFGRGIWFTTGPCLSVGYAWGAARAVGRGGMLGHGFASAGRLALTNFVMQSGVMAVLFGGFGLALEGKVGYSAGALISPWTKSVR